MVGYNEVLLTILLVLTSILVIVLIIAGIKLVYTVDKINIILNDVENKVKSVNGFFSMIDKVSDTVSYVSDGITNAIVNTFERVFSRKK